MSYKSIFICAIICGILSYLICYITHEIKISMTIFEDNLNVKYEVLEEQLTDRIDIYGIELD